jgi:hypothetical protein
MSAVYTKNVTQFKPLKIRKSLGSTILMIIFNASGRWGRGKVGEATPQGLLGVNPIVRRPDPRIGETWNRPRSLQGSKTTYLHPQRLFISPYHLRDSRYRLRLHTRSQCQHFNPSMPTSSPLYTDCRWGQIVLAQPRSHIDSHRNRSDTPVRMSFQPA